MVLILMAKMDASGQLPSTVEALHLSFSLEHSLEGL
jgi:hypothetical protein